jgi:glycine/D-amino acid oxidase-like deaminating enzyme/nitrite reductase/ring-hydroxylating ferredoxin subunit
MNASQERSVSLWMETGRVEQAGPITRDERADIVVVGAGIAGLSVAYELCRRGQSVVVLDRGALGGGMTARTTAHIASELDDFYFELIKMRGLDEARLYFQSQAAALDRIEEIQRGEAVDCDFARLDGYLFAASPDDLSTLEEEIDACERVGFQGVSWVDGAPGSIPGFGRGLRFPNQARFHPLKYLDGLARCIRRDGGKLFADTPVTGIEEKGDEVVVSTERGHTVRAGAAVVATNSPINDWVAIHTKQAPYRTYVVAGQVARGSIPDALYWDTLDPYHYVRLQPGDEGSDWLIVGGEDHKTGQAHDTEERFGRLEQWTRERFPMIESVDYRWSGQIIEPVDYLAYIGKNPGGDEHIWIATGDSGNGMTHGTIAGIILNELVQGRKHQWARLYEPSRVKLRATPEFVKENVNVAEQYKDWFTGSHAGDIAAIKPGEGAVIGRGRGKVAVYKDERGEVHGLSAVCTHLYGIVNWNVTERTWDCPCHGSRFDPYGKVVNGPAIVGLSPASPEPKKE